MPCTRGYSNWIVPALLTLGGLLLQVPAHTQDEGPLPGKKGARW